MIFLLHCKGFGNVVIRKERDKSLKTVLVLIVEFVLQI